MNIIPFSELSDCDLIYNSIYEGGITGNLKSDVLSHIFPVGNVGGFRYLVNGDGKPYICFLKTSLNNDLWPDRINESEDQFTYYGDNKNSANIDLHKNKGNRLLRDTFDLLYEGNKYDIALFLIFSKAKKGHDVQFNGIAVPSGTPFEDNENLIAVWKTKNGKRILNYKANFTIFKGESVSREWLNYIISNKNIHSEYMPTSYKQWLES